jgi:RNA polymerase sigma-70 factor (ECF subfamily)
LGTELRDSDWFTRTYAAHYIDIVRYGVRRLPDPESAAELAQEVFVVAWRRRTEVPDRSLPWLYGVARYLLANHRRRSGRSVAGASAVDQIAVEVVGSEAAGAVADVRAALTRLSEQDQEILRLIGWEELTVAEAAQTLGCTRATAGVRLHRARRRLQAELDRPSPARSRASTAPQAPAGRVPAIDANPSAPASSRS